MIGEEKDVMIARLARRNEPDCGNAVLATWNLEHGT